MTQAMSGYGMPLTATALYGVPPSATPTASNNPAPANPQHAGQPEPAAARPDRPSQSKHQKMPLGLLHQSSAVIVAIAAIGLLSVWWLGRED